MQSETVENVGEKQRKYNYSCYHYPGVNVLILSFTGFFLCIPTFFKKKLEIIMHILGFCFLFFYLND